MRQLLNQQDRDVADYLESIGVIYRPGIKQIAVENDSGWKHDLFTIEFGRGFSPLLGDPQPSNCKQILKSDFRAGTGHRIKRRDYQLEELKGFRRALRIPGGYATTSKNLGSGDYVIVPTSANVLSCLLSDADYGDLTFRDFCEELGYNEDSISHRRIYFDCQETFNNLRGFFSGEELQHLREVLADY